MCLYEGRLDNCPGVVPLRAFSRGSAAFEGCHALRVFNMSAGTHRNKFLELFSVGKVDFCKCQLEGRGCRVSRAESQITQDAGHITTYLERILYRPEVALDPSRVRPRTVEIWHLANTTSTCKSTIPDPLLHDIYPKKGRGLS